MRALEVHNQTWLELLTLQAETVHTVHSVQPHPNANADASI